METMQSFFVQSCTLFAGETLCSLSYYNWCGAWLIKTFFIVFTSQDVLHNAPLNAFWPSS